VGTEPGLLAQLRVEVIRAVLLAAPRLNDRFLRAPGHRAINIYLYMALMTPMILVPPPPGIVPRFLMTPFDLYDYNFSLMMDAEAPGGRRRGMGQELLIHHLTRGLLMDATPAWEAPGGRRGVTGHGVGRSTAALGDMLLPPEEDQRKCKPRPPPPPPVPTRWSRP
jgi:hypothetical protein